MTGLIQLTNGDEVDYAGGWCALCSFSFGGSATIRRAKYLGGKFYHLTCYPAAVEIFLADEKVRKSEREE